MDILLSFNRVTRAMAPTAGGVRSWPDAVCLDRPIAGHAMLFQLDEAARALAVVCKKKRRESCELAAQLQCNLYNDG